ncbi:MAG: hypothetical protein V3W04_06620 [Gammaproteobacteria bacterium]
MAINLNNKTIMTTRTERLLIELAGENPDRVFTKKELSHALIKAMNLLAKAKSPLLIKIYNEYARRGKLPPLEELKKSINL